MADINPNDSATLTDGLEIDSYDDVVNLLGAGEAAAMLADAVGNRFNRQDIMKAILRRTARGHLACVGRWPHRPG